MSKKGAGYGKPPDHARWKKGQSGNPRGRPQGPRNLTGILAKELQKVLSIREGGVLKRVTAGQAIGKRIIADAVKGEKAATALLVRISHLEDVTDTGKPAGLSETDKEIMQHFLRLNAEQEKDK